MDKRKLSFILELFFPEFCLGCHKSGNYLCQDCFALADISNRTFKNNQEPFAVYSSCDYSNFIVKRLIRKFKYPPFAKELSIPLALLIITYFINLEKQPDFLKKGGDKEKEFIIISAPLFKKRLKWRGFNQAKEIALILSEFLNIPFQDNVVIKIKETPFQTNLLEDKRKANLKGVFICKKPELVKGKTILLVDDVFTTGTTMNEIASILKKSKAKEIIGITVARG